MEPPGKIEPLEMSERVALTVSELIQLLAQYPGDLRVMVQGYEEGYDDLEAGRVVAGEASLNVNSAWYYGRHEQALTGDEQTGAETVQALFLRRPSHDEGE